MRDPIVDAVRAIRDEIARENNYDVKSIFRMLRRYESSGAPHVKLLRNGSKKLLRDVQRAEGEIVADRGVPEKKARKAPLAARKK